MGQNIHKEPSAELSDRLFFLWESGLNTQEQFTGSSFIDVIFWNFFCILQNSMDYLLQLENRLLLIFEEQISLIPFIKKYTAIYFYSEHFLGHFSFIDTAQWH